MNNIYCTLYNSLYLDKGLVLYDSLDECTSDFKLYVLCMDEKCYDVLSSLNLSKQIPIKLQDIESDELLRAKSNRPFGEYCWTCTSALIEYVLLKLKEPICTYIDADMYFYKDPAVLIEEMVQSCCSVQMVPHRFSEERIKSEQIVGRYCVEFNTFKNDVDGLTVLKNWKEKCLDCCSNLGDGVHWGDQKYLDEWPKMNGVHVCENLGAGLAFWNVIDYRLFEGNCKQLLYKRTNENCELIFYHFASITYLSRKNIFTNIYTGNYNMDYGLIKMLYEPYLYKLEEKKQLLEREYGLSFIVKRHPVSQSSFYSRFINSDFAWFFRKLFGHPMRYIIEIKNV